MKSTEYKPKVDVDIHGPKIGDPILDIHGSRLDVDIHGPKMPGLDIHGSKIDAGLDIH